MAKRRLTAELASELSAARLYEGRYGKGIWAGRDGTTEEGLNSLVGLGLLRPSRDENYLRVLYRLTEAGLEALDA